jgi:hypothetical protein
VRNWIGNKIKRRGGKKAVDDAHFFDAEKQQDRPQDVRELRG